MGAAQSCWPGGVAVVGEQRQADSHNKAPGQWDDGKHQGQGVEPNRSPSVPAGPAHGGVANNPVGKLSCPVSKPQAPGERPACLQSQPDPQVLPASQARVRAAVDRPLATTLVATADTFMVAQALEAEAATNAYNVTAASASCHRSSLGSCMSCEPTSMYSQPAVAMSSTAASLKQALHLDGAHFEWLPDTTAPGEMIHDSSPLQSNTRLSLTLSGAPVWSQRSQHQSHTGFASSLGKMPGSPSKQAPSSPLAGRGSQPAQAPANDLHAAKTRITETTTAGSLGAQQPAEQAGQSRSLGGWQLGSPSKSTRTQALPLASSPSALRPRSGGGVMLAATAAVAQYVDDPASPFGAVPVSASPAAHVSPVAAWPSPEQSFHTPFAAAPRLAGLDMRTHLQRSREGQQHGELSPRPVHVHTFRSTLPARTGSEPAPTTANAVTADHGADGSLPAAERSITGGGTDGGLLFANTAKPRFMTASGCASRNLHSPAGLAVPAATGGGGNTAGRPRSEQQLVPGALTGLSATAARVTAGGMRISTQGASSLQGMAPTSLLQTSPHLPEDMVRGVWQTSQYRLMKQLHSGYASKLYQAMCLMSRSTVAMKVYRLAGKSDLERLHLYREVTLHSQLAHANVVQFHAAFKERNNVIIVLEYVNGGTLRAFLNAHGGALPEPVAARVVRQLLLALRYLHSQGILHRDIKPENILLDMTTNSIKLADFGLAINTYVEPANTRAGTLPYMAPEQLMVASKKTPQALDKSRLINSLSGSLGDSTSPRKAMSEAGTPLPTSRLQQQHRRVETCDGPGRVGSARRAEEAWQDDPHVPRPAAAHASEGVHEHPGPRMDQDAGSATKPAMQTTAKPAAVPATEPAVKQVEEPLSAEERFYGLSTDIWQLGILTYELLVGVTPFASRTDEGVVQRIAQGDVRLPYSLSAAARSFILQSLVWEGEARRPTVEELLQHAWMLGDSCGSFTSHSMSLSMEMGMSSSGCGGGGTAAAPGLGGRTRM